MTTMKGTKIGTFFHKHAGTQTIKYNRKERLFFVQVSPEECVTDADERTCERKAMARLTELTSYEWKQMIRVESMDTGSYNIGGRRPKDEHDAGFRFRFERFEKATHADGVRYVQRKHRLDAEADYPSDSEAFKNWERGLTADHLWVRDADEVELPYTDEAWEGLCHLAVMLEALRDRLDQLIDPKGSTKTRVQLKAFLHQLAKRKPAFNLLPEKAETP